MKGFNVINALRAAVLLLASQVLAGCVTTNDLYADYHCGACQAPVIAALATATVGAPGLAWEQAVYFGYDLSTLDEIETARLDGNLKVLQNFPTMKVAVSGHTDSHNTVAYNNALSKRRVDTVRDYFLSMGIALDRIVEVPASEYQALFPDNDDEIKRATNRRVEMVLLDADRRPATLELSNVRSPENPLKTGDVGNRGLKTDRIGF